MFSRQLHTHLNAHVPLRIVAAPLGRQVRQRIVGRFRVRGGTRERSGGHLTGTREPVNTLTRQHHALVEAILSGRAEQAQQHEGGGGAAAL